MKREWRAYDRFRKNEVKLFLEKARELVWSLPSPWEPRHGGRRAYPTRGKVMCALLKVKFNMDYRTIESFLRVNREFLEIMELDKPPSKSVIHDAVKRIPQGYLKQLNDRLVESFKKGVLELIAQASPSSAMKRGSA